MKIIYLINILMMLLGYSIILTFLGFLIIEAIRIHKYGMWKEKWRKK